MNWIRGVIAAFREVDERHTRAILLLPSIRKYQTILLSRNDSPHPAPSGHRDSPSKPVLFITTAYHGAGRHDSLGPRDQQRYSVVLHHVRNPGH